MTAEKEQALTVLSDKIPEEIKDLVIASIGSSTSDTEQLRLSIQRMQDSLSNLDIADTQNKVASLTQLIDSSQNRLREIDELLATALEKETSKFNATTGKRLASETAHWLHDNCNTDIIPDTIQEDAPLPLEEKDFQEFITLCRSLSEDDIHEALQTLPDPTQLLTKVELEKLYEELNVIQQSLEQAADNGLNLIEVDNHSDKQLASAFTTATASLEKLKEFDTGWEQNLSQSIRDDPQQRSWLLENMKKINSLLQALLELNESNLGHLLNVPEGNPAIQLKLIDQWLERVERGQGLPKLSNRALRDFSKTVLVDSYMPSTTKDLELVRKHIQARTIRTQLLTLISQTFNGNQIPLDGLENFTDIQLSSYMNKVLSILKWWHKDYERTNSVLKQFLTSNNQVLDVESLEASINLLNTAKLRKRQRSLSHEITDVKSKLDSASSTSYVVQQAKNALTEEDAEKWGDFLTELSRLNKIKVQAQRFQFMKETLSESAPIWSTKIIETHGDVRVCGETENYPLSWELAKARNWLGEIVGGNSIADLLKESEKINLRLRKAIKQSVSLLTRLHIKQTQKQDDRRALNIWLDATKRVGKGTGKNAASYLATARHQLPTAMNAMPVWIMPIHKVLENFDPSVSEPFDVIIVDESSQCDLLSVGVLALAKKAVIVGDDKQTSPSAAFQKVSEIMRLQDKYIPDFPERTLFTADESLYSLSNRTFSSQVMLREHFRCVPEIIDYSNRFYGNQIIPLRERTHPKIGSPLRAKFIPITQNGESTNDNVNLEEARAITKQIVDCTQDAAYEGLSFGVVTLMSGKQQDLISELLLDELGTEEYYRRKIRVGNPPLFQGDERDVIFLSFISTNANPHAYAATRDWNAQWVNVAASRAKDQLWAFYSMDPSTLREDDYRRGLIEYIRDYTPEASSKDNLETTKTSFEREILHQLVAHGFESHVQPHFQVGRFTIDLVVTISPGYRLAIECDGDTEESRSAFREAIDKQRVLERLGWHFARISAPEYYLHPETTLNQLWDRLDNLRQESSNLSRHSPKIEIEKQASHITKAGPVQQTDRKQVTHKPATKNSNIDVIAVDKQKQANSVFEYNKGLHVAAPPLTNANNKESLQAWIQYVCLSHVEKEYPLLPGALLKSILPDLEKLGLSLPDSRAITFKTLRDLESKNQLTEDKQGFYYPVKMNSDYKITLSRPVNFISTNEFAAIMRQLVIDNPGKGRVYIFNELFNVYKYKVVNYKINEAFLTAYNLLRHKKLIEERNGLVYPTNLSLSDIANFFAFLDVDKHKAIE